MGNEGLDPVAVGRLEMWDGGDGNEWPHVHYACSHCGEEHNFDVEPDTTNPRFHACCREEGVKFKTLVSWPA